MSRASKEAKKEAEAKARAKKPTVHAKLPIYLRGTLEVQNSKNPHRLVPNPSFNYPPSLK